VKQSDDLTELLQFGLEFERGEVKLYSEAVEMIGTSDRALVLLLEEILLDEQEGVDHLQKLLADPSGSAASTGKKAVG
jgi:bacterioferritin